MRGRRRKPEGEVELNLAAMLDMAFQLLAFFILTFQPSPLEGQITLRMPPPHPIARPANTSRIEPSSDTAVSLQSAVVRVMANSDGELASIRIEEAEPATNLQVFEKQLSELFVGPNLPFEQLVLQIAPNLHYEQLMRVLETCTHVRTPSGERLNKVSIIELPEGS